MKVIDAVKMNLSEISHGAKEVKFAYINPKSGKTITPYCKCKDFFNDMFFTEKTGTPVSIFGFKWTKGDGGKVLNADMLTLAIKLTGKGTGKDVAIDAGCLDSMKEIVDMFSKALGYKECEIGLCEDKAHIILTYDRKWSEIPYLNSALFFIIRLGFTYKSGEDVIKFFEEKEDFISPNDAMYFKSAKQRVKDMLNGKIDSKQSYTDYTTDSIHNNSGLVHYKDYSIR